MYACKNNKKPSRGVRWENEKPSIYSMCMRVYGISALCVSLRQSLPSASFPFKPQELGDAWRMVLRLHDRPTTKNKKIAFNVLLSSPAFWILMDYGPYIFVLYRIYLFIIRIQLDWINIRWAESGFTNHCFVVYKQANFHLLHDAIVAAA